MISCQNCLYIIYKIDENVWVRISPCCTSLLIEKELILNFIKFQCSFSDGKLLLYLILTLSSTTLLVTSESNPYCYYTEQTDYIGVFCTYLLISGLRNVERCHMGNQNPPIEDGQTIQCHAKTRRKKNNGPQNTTQKI